MLREDLLATNFTNRDFKQEAKGKTEVGLDQGVSKYSNNNRD